jgi:hypothetical protein
LPPPDRTDDTSHHPTVVSHDNFPKRGLEADLPRLVSEYPLCGESSRPAAQESDEEQVTLGDATVPALGKSFIEPIRQECPQTRDGDEEQIAGGSTHESISNAQVHLFGLQGDAITYLHCVEAAEGMGVIEQGFSPRISPDGRSALVLHDFGVGGKGTLDDVLLVDLTLAKPEVTQRLPQVGDGLESLAFHPSGRFAVICCLNKGANITTTSHLATVELTSRPLRVLNYLPIDPVPEGIEFTADGKQLFVQAALANHIVVFDVDADAMLLQRSPFVLHTGHAPSAMSISPRFQQ